MIVGKSGVGKSTLINNLLKLKGDQQAKHGVGNFQTVDIQAYTSQNFPLLRFIDTRGIELNHNYGADAVKNDAMKFIERQIRTNNPNNFVQCIWYCITGNRFEQAEIDLLNSLRLAYDNNRIPIVIVYTQATDNNAINGMRDYIKERNIDAQFIKVLAERKELVNNQYLEAFGLDELVDETLKRCNKAMNGEMRSVMTNNIAMNIKNKLIEENSYICKYIYEQQILNFTSFYGGVLSDKEFINYIINLLGINVEFFLEKKMGDKSKNYLNGNDFIYKNITNYIDYYKDYTNKLIGNVLNKYAIDFIDFQVLVERNENKEIRIKNKRCIKEFINTSRNFLNDNYYYISQIQFIYYLLKDFCFPIIKSFEENANQIIMKMIATRENQSAISNCFSKKFAEFEKRVSQFFKDNDFLRPDNNGFRNFNYETGNFNNENNNHLMNEQFNRNINENEDDLPNESQIYGNNYNNQNEYNNYPNF